MSGGSLKHLYLDVEAAAVEIAAHYGQSGVPGDETKRYSTIAIAFSQLLMQVSKALHDIEWDMSGDGSDWKEVLALIGPREEAVAVAANLETLVTQAREVLKRMGRL